MFKLLIPSKSSKSSTSETPETPRGEEGGEDARAARPPIPFTAWNSDNGINKLLKKKMRDMFGDSNSGWEVINVVGDGYCGLYAIRIGHLLIRDDVSEPVPAHILLHPARNALVENIIKGVKIYRETREKIIADLFRYSPSIDEDLKVRIRYLSQDYFPYEMPFQVEVMDILQQLVRESTNIPITAMLLHMLSVMQITHHAWLGQTEFEFNIEDDFRDENFRDENRQLMFNESKREQLRLLIPTDYAVDMGILGFLAYHYQHHFISFFNERTRSDGDKNVQTTSVHFINYRIDDRSAKNEDHRITYCSLFLEERVKNTSLLFNNGHYIVFHNSDKDVKETLIEQLITRKGLNERNETMWGVWVSSFRETTFEYIYNPSYVGPSPDEAFMATQTALMAAREARWLEQVRRDASNDMDVLKDQEKAVRAAEMASSKKPSQSKKSVVPKSAELIALEAAHDEADVGYEVAKADAAKAAEAAMEVLMMRRAKTGRLDKAAIAAARAAAETAEASEAAAAAAARARAYSKAGPSRVDRSEAGPSDWMAATAKAKAAAWKAEIEAKAAAKERAPAKERTEKRAKAAADRVETAEKAARAAREAAATVGTAAATVGMVAAREAARSPELREWLAALAAAKAEAAAAWAAREADSIYHPEAVAARRLWEAQHKGEAHRSVRRAASAEEAAEAEAREAERAAEAEALAAVAAFEVAEKAEKAEAVAAKARSKLDRIFKKLKIPLTDKDKEYLMSWYNDDYSDTITLTLVSRFSFTNETAYKTLAQMLNEWKATKIAANDAEAYQAGGKQKSKRIRKKTRSRLTHRKQLKQKQTQRKKSKQTQRKKLKQTRRK